MDPLLDNIRQLAPAIRPGLDASVEEAYDAEAFNRARTDERVTIIAYECARSADSRLRPWNYLAPSERRLWRLRREELAQEARQGAGRLATPSERHDRAWLVFGAITSALLSASPAVLGEALALFEEETRRAQRVAPEEGLRDWAQHVTDMMEQRARTPSVGVAPGLEDLFGSVGPLRVSLWKYGPEGR